MRRFILGVLTSIVISPAGIASAECVNYEDYLQPLGAQELPQWPRGVGYQAPYLYIVDEDGRLSIIDAADPEHMEEAASLMLPGAAVGIAVEGDLACVTLYPTKALQLVDIAKPEAPALLGSVDLPAFPSGVDVHGSHAYITGADYAQDDHGVYIIDISDPLAPFVANRVEVDTYPENIHIRDHYAYVIDYGDFWVLDLNEPIAPPIVAHVEIPYAPLLYMDSNDAYVFLAAMSPEWPPLGDGFYIVNIMDPTNPFLEGQYTPDGAPCYGVGVWEHLAIVGSWGSGMHFFDISHPAEPMPIQSIGVQNDPGFFVVDG